MIKILTKKQWQKLVDTVDYHQETIRRLNAEMRSIKKQEELKSHSLRQRIRLLEKRVRETEKRNKQNKKKRQWQ